MAVARKSNPRKKRRTAKQIAATKRLVALNKKRRTKRKTNPAKKTVTRKTNPRKKSTAKKRTVSRKKKAAPRRRSKKTMAARKRTTRRRNPVRRVKAKSNPTTTTLQANPRRRRRRKSTTRRRRRRNPTTRANNPWYGQPRRHRDAAKKGWSRRRRGACKTRYARAKKGGRRRTYRRSNPAVAGTLTRTLMGHHSSTNARLANPLSTNPINGKVLTSLAVTGAGLGFGLMVAELTDRWYATRTPAKTTSGAGGLHPWYGRNAAIAYQRRPDAMRLAVQGGGAIAALTLTTWTRKLPVLPFLFAGTTLGFAGKLFQQLFTWYVLPKVLKVEDPGEQTLANRLAPLEQDAVQDRVDELMADYMQIQDLALNQQEQAIVKSPLNVGGEGIVTLGKTRKDAEGNPVPFVETGHVGQCDQCSGQGGHYTTCPGLNADCNTCPPFPDGQGIPADQWDFTPPQGRPRCEYVIQEGDDIYELAEKAGVSVNDIAALNDGDVVALWRVGASVILPYEVCTFVQSRPAATVAGTPEARARGLGFFPEAEEY